ncbi:dienelactone hydrolase family protein [bacterium]|nr:dienelactone hydrolase family protein [bacterium]
MVETSEYMLDSLTFEGKVVYDKNLTGKRPGILVFHQWKGASEYEEMRARQLAELGYAAFVVDMYGKGVRAENREEASKLAGALYEDGLELRARAQKAFKHAKELPQFDEYKMAAIGYCFGGTCVLELARDGAYLAGVVSFHGGLKPLFNGGAGKTTARILALHGAEDPHVTPSDLKAFEDELTKANVDWQLVKFSDAVHSFTMKSAGDDPSKGSAYNEKADRRSWEYLLVFLDEIFGQAE